MTDDLKTALIAGAVAIAVASLSAFNERRRQIDQFKSESHRQAEQIRAETERQAEHIRESFRLQEERLKAELRTEFMAEAAINRMLREAEPKRSFAVLKRRIGGFTDPELRQLLVRSGALCYWTNDAEPKELWGLMERNEP